MTNNGKTTRNVSSGQGTHGHRIDSFASIHHWLLISGNRITVSIVLLSIVLIALVLSSLIWTFEMQVLLTETDTVEMLFNSMLMGTILLVTIVVSINSIVLSQELTGLGTQRDRIENTIEFRKSIEEMAEVDVSPTSPEEFIGTNIQLISDRIDELQSSIDDCDPEMQQDIDAVLSKLRSNNDELSNRIQLTDQDSINVLLAGLVYDHARAIHDVRHLNISYSNEWSDDQREQFDTLIEAIKSFTIILEYFKSLYYMRELSTLSRVLLYVALPVIVYSSYIILAVSAGRFPDVGVFGLSSLSVFMMVSYTIALAPYVILTSFVLRSATVAINSLGVDPFTLRN